MPLSLALIQYTSGYTHIFANKTTNYSEPEKIKKDSFFSTSYCDNIGFCAGGIFPSFFKFFTDSLYFECGVNCFNDLRVAELHYLRFQVGQ